MKFTNLFFVLTLFLSNFGSALANDANSANGDVSAQVRIAPPIRPVIRTRIRPGEDPRLIHDQTCHNGHALEHLKRMLEKRKHLTGQPSHP